MRNRLRKLIGRPVATGAAVVVVVGGAVAGVTLGLTGSSGGPGTTGTTTTTITTTANPRFRPGVCGGGRCTPSAIARYNLNVPDSDEIGCGADRCGSPATIDPAIFIERPKNLTAAPAPLLISYAGSVPGDPNWIAASAADAFVYVTLRPNHHCSRSCQYADPTTAVAPICPDCTGTVPNYQDCGASGHLSCDDIPWVQGVIRALERCSSATSTAGATVGDWVAAGDRLPAYGGSGALTGNGAPPCEHINQSEVFVEGGSRGGGMTLATACDTRTSGLVAAVTDVSDPLPGVASRTTPPNCPALLPFDSARCVSDCVAATPNTKLSMQLIWGDTDPNFPLDTSLCDRTNPANDCLGVGYPDTDALWTLGLITLATTVFGHPVFGCSTAPTSTATTGASGKVTVTTYATGCTDPHVAMQTIRVGSGQHLPDTWPFGHTSGIICSSDCTDRSGADGLVEPLAAWDFWTSYLP